VIPIEVVKEWMGHRGINTKMIYSKVKRGTLNRTTAAVDDDEVSTRAKKVIIGWRNPLK
jgi:hypothetical protein